MKVGTDAILLGAWATAANPAAILDIGTGTGIVALMLAQRFPKTVVEAVEIDEPASRQAAANFANSPWSDRLSLTHAAVQDFPFARHYSLIVCNPPYFQNSLKPINHARRKARHDDSLSSAELAGAANRLLSQDGRLCVILPADQRDAFVVQAGSEDLHCARQRLVHPTPQHPPKRILLEFSKDSCSQVVEEGSMSIELIRHQYSPEYLDLAGDFLLRMHEQS
ncbi:MAG: methyltransferase [Fuerstiella sp.]|nr:methyltransferase [Fuerstiella sp.]MDG2128555.1 methyltransferase [Fuerstiella sp.]